MKEDIPALRLLIKALHGRAEVLNLIGRNAEALKDADLLVKTASSAGDDRNNAEGLHQLSIIHSKLSDFENMRKYAEKALMFYRKLNDKEGQSSALAYIGEYYLVNGKLDKTKKYYEDSLALIEKMGESREYVNQLNNQATFYSDHLGEFEKAIVSLKKVLKVARRNGYTQIEGAALNNIANVYQRRGNIEKALEYGNLALEITGKVGDKDGIATIMNNIAALNYFLGNPAKSIEMFNESLKIRAQIGDKRGMGICHNNIGYIDEGRGVFESALYHYSQALELRQQIGDKPGEGETLNNLSSYYKQTGDLPKALDYAFKSFAIRKETGESRGIKLCLRRISDIYAAMKDYDKAVEYRVKFSQMANPEEAKGDMINIGSLYYRNGELDKADEYFMRILRTDLEKSIMLNALCGLCDTALLRNDAAKVSIYINKMNSLKDSNAEEAAYIYKRRLQNRKSPSAVMQKRRKIRTECNTGLCLVLAECEDIYCRKGMEAFRESIDREAGQKRESGDFQAAGEIYLHGAVFLKSLGDMEYKSFRKIAESAFTKSKLSNWLSFTDKL